MKTILLAILLTCLIQTSKADDWTTGDTVRQVTYLTIQAMDWNQTRHIAKHPETYSEVTIDSIIGKHPSTKNVDAWMLSTMILHTGLVYILPSSTRKVFQYTSIVMKGDAVAKNYVIGLRVKF